MIEEHTAIADVQLEAVALSPAMVGAAFKVRLTVGGKVMRVMALGPGHATFQLKAEVQP
jgi:flagella basal body P-ring formation protein FlgA